MSKLLSRLMQLQCHFTWDLDQDTVDLGNLCTRLQDHIKLELGQPEAMARSYSLLAYVRYLQDDREEAMRLLNQSQEKIREVLGEDSERRLIVTYGDVAWLEYHTGNFMMSQTYCQKVEDILLKYPTDSSTALHPEVHGEKAWTYLKFSRSYYPKAIECFRKVLELQPDDSEWNAGLAISLYRSEPAGPKNPTDEESEATTQLRRAVDVNPNDGVLLSMLALKLVKHQKHQESEELVERALKINPDNPHITRYIAKYLRSQGEYERSIDLLKRALERTSESAFVHHQLALCYMTMKITEQCKSPSKNKKVKDLRRLCIQHLEAAVKIKSTFVLAMADLALMYGEEKDLIRAEQVFKQAEELLTDTESSISQLFHQRYGDYNFYHTKEKDKAIDQYTRGLQISVETRERLLCIKKLTLIAQRRLEENQNDGRAYALLGEVAKAKGDKKDAMENYAKALNCDEDNDEYLSALMALRIEHMELK